MKNFVTTSKPVSPSWLCRLLGCILYGPYYGMPQSHCWRCGMITGYANPALNLPMFVEPAMGRSWWRGT